LLLALGLGMTKDILHTIAEVPTTEARHSAHAIGYRIQNWR
jgi:hypothetical protein